MSGHSEAPQPKVFISYSRHDSSGLAEELATGLGLIGFDALLDRLDIAAGEDWEKRLATLIQSADTVLFILSPESVKSGRCSWEVQMATRLSKRVIPVIGTPVADADVPEPLRSLNYIFFSTGRSFTKSLGEVADALRIDLDWIREHTRLAEVAARWDTRDRTEALLLRGAELQQARAWMGERRPGAPECTDLQRAFIGASSDAESALANKERQQLEAMAKAQATHAEALSERESALRRLRRRTLMANGAIAVVFLVAAIAGWKFIQDKQVIVRTLERVRVAEENSVQKAIEKEAARTDIEGQLVAYAASPGQIAWDGVDGGKNSPYTKFLLEELDDQNLSLQIALARANRKVLTSTKNQQRPFVASDLGGDIYLRRAPSSRRCEALLVSVDSFGKATGSSMFNVENDAIGWERFLGDQKCKTRRLKNPKSGEVLAAIRSIDFAAGKSPSHPDGPSPVTRGPESAPSNTYLLFVFAGGGFELQGEQHLFAANTDVTSTKLAETTGLKISAVQAMIRSKAAASVLILDADFQTPLKAR